MGVLTNGFRDTIGVYRLYGGTALNNCYPQGARGNYARTGMMRNITAGEGITDDKVGVPMGYGDRGWVMPQKGGMMSARAAGLTVAATATGVLGMPGEGAASFTIAFAAAAGELIVSGAGTASFTISTNTPLLTASINGAGTASFALSASGLLGAEASIEGAASFAITGTLTPYAVGFMEGSTEGGGALTEASIATAVWSASAAGNAGAGTMGELLNGAGGGSSPGAVADAVWASAIRTLTGMSPAIKEEIAVAVWGHTQ